MPSKLRRRTAVLSLICASLLLPAASSGAAPQKGVVRSGEGTVRTVVAGAAEQRQAPRARAAQECANADVIPSAANRAAVRGAILCLHNQIRAELGLPLLRENGRLRKAAEGHSADMVAKGFFEHTTPSGVSMVERIRAARYVPRNVGWALGENLAWGTGRLATPRLIMRAWMDSPGHRANVLRRAYREIGIGVVVGTPSAGGNGATYTADFGVIRR